MCLWVGGWVQAVLSAAVTVKTITSCIILHLAQFLGHLYDHVQSLHPASQSSSNSHFQKHMQRETRIWLIVPFRLPTLRAHPVLALNPCARHKS